MSNISDALEIRQKYKHFRILVIGRANAGKTTLLKRVCNTTEEPSIYNEGKSNLLEGTDKRGVHDINRAFTFASNPQFLFHDSAGFEAGSEEELKEVQAFIAEHAKANEVADQLHAIWPVSTSPLLQMFCFTPDIARPLLELENRFFNEERPQNVPLVAIFTKFDDLIIQVYDDDKSEDENRQAAEHELETKFKKPLYGYRFPPKAHVCTEDLNDDEGSHQDQVKELMTKTADSLDDLALKLLFVSVQQNNLELCIHSALEYMHHYSSGLSKKNQIRNALSWFSHAYQEDHVRMSHV
ncbi:hypothetical protein BDN72DRAFT_847128 [Pluteus cervinus]|uniref:Uncharacterized protein n=1 Tax=Pluteus cervinus TaxID=181527 RepID=A0ACD3AGG6_9AGAR|nr:hypothetical protein BDN72DRAFT_847128 [Pluteus cervinus]